MVQEVFTMNITEETIHGMQQLPRELQKEVLDFVLFLKHKLEKEETDNLMFAQSKSMLTIWDNDEDESWNNVPTW